MAYLYDEPSRGKLIETGKQCWPGKGVGIDGLMGVIFKPAGPIPDSDLQNGKMIKLLRLRPLCLW